ncbi:MAG: M81 family metallopeptidase [Alphaproteobacteria bacterium]|nr:M81 family metallopeptidase [Alphaproteobacteria bacterium]
MRIFTASLVTETNTFSPIPTGERSFAERMLRRGDGSRQPPTGGNIPLIVWRERAERDGHEVAEGLCAYAAPAGRTLAAAYAKFKAAILEDLRAAMPVDAVMLFMHGAMVAHGQDDCEGDVAAAVRAIVGPGVPIGMELDLHCHLTEAMRTACDVIVAYKEYPHVDAADRAHEVYDLVTRAARGEIRPVMAFHDCRMVDMWRTPVEPMKSFVARMAALEGRDAILSVSFGHGFPWGDVADVGAKTVVVADGDEARARALAARLAAEVFAMRDATHTAHDTVDAAIDAALAAPRGPVVLAEVADNAGGGAPSDSTFVLRRLVERGVRDAAIGHFWDPVAVRFCAEAGEGATLELRVGGKCGPVSGDPVDLVATVRRVVEDHLQTGLSGGTSAMGTTAWIEAGGIDIVLNTARTQPFHPDGFEKLGIELARKRIVVVKSTQHFHAGFAPIAAAIRYVATPGSIAPSFESIPYTKRRLPYWPRVADPFAT